jgi:hypothetical protein
MGTALVRRTLSVLVAALAALPLLASAASTATRYGNAEVTPEGNAFVLSFGGTRIATFEGLGVDLHRVTAAGADDYLIVDRLLPGLHCRHEFSVLQISPAGVTVLSKTFGECTELAGTKHLPHGIIVRTRSPHVEGNKQQQSRTYQWSKGRLAELR